MVSSLKKQEVRMYRIRRLEGTVTGGEQVRRSRKKRYTQVLVQEVIKYRNMR